MTKSKKKKKLKGVIHVTYNKKEFLAPDCLLSSSMIHTKVKPDGIAQIRISDCNRSIVLWNDLNNKQERHDIMEKVNTLIDHLEAFKTELIIRTSNP